MLLLLLGFVLSFFRLPWASRWSVLLGAGLLFLFAFTSFGYLVVQPLEGRFVRPAEPASITGIIVLGGGMDAEINATRGGWELNRAGDRFIETLRLALAHPEARVVISGGNSAFSSGAEPEAVAGARIFTAFGIAPERLLLDKASRNTEENAQFAKALVQPKPGETWLLVTSAFHMPRSMGLFRKAGFPVVAWPADYLASGKDGIGLRLQEPGENLAITQVALREWAALAGYYLSGRIDQLLPGP